MNRSSIAAPHPEAVVAGVFEALTSGDIETALRHFADTVAFHDHGIRLELRTRERVAEYFQRLRELFPNASLRAVSTVASGDRVAVTWTFRGTLNLDQYGPFSRILPLSLPGVSLVVVRDEKIVAWSDYYDSCTAWRSSLASHFEDWDGV